MAGSLELGSLGFSPEFGLFTLEVEFELVSLLTLGFSAEFGLFTLEFALSDDGCFVSTLGITAKVLFKEYASGRPYLLWLIGKRPTGFF